MNIAIIGTGNVGGALTERWARAMIQGQGRNMALKVLKR